MAKKFYGVIGYPIKHSKSPDIFKYLFEKYHIDGEYGAFEVDRGELGGFLAVMGETLSGVNVTMPLKEEAARAANSLDGASKFLKSVNVLDLNNGKGYTTDGKGLVLSMEYNNVVLRGSNVVILGAGGAAKSIAYEVAGAGVESLTVLNRTEEKSKALAELLGQRAKGDGLENAPMYVKECDILINATGGGMDGANPMDLSFINALPQRAVVYDIVYKPRETGLMAKAKANGNRVIGGVDMLICQAFYTFEIFTGVLPAKEDYLELLKEV